MFQMPKPQRLRDPVHDLIEFDDGEFESAIWKIIDTSEFQRLRRIKQLGFSEFVYPGATHTRFAHSVGVFNTARQLCRVVSSQRPDQSNVDSIRTASVAALVHDLGHGPFSHAFEEAMKALKKKKKHEHWTVDIINESTELGNLIADLFDNEFRKKVSDILTSEIPENVFGAIVSSQFDADRLDYIRRDRLMTGADYGKFDYSWVLANLEVADVPITVDDTDLKSVSTLILGPKALQAAEAYVLGLFQLYFCVYFHKATRSAEVMLTAILTRLGELVVDEKVEISGLYPENLICRFLARNDLETYLRLDDYAVWSTVNMLRDSPDDILRELSSRLLDRQLYKVVDVADSFRGDQAKVMQFRMEFSERLQDGAILQSDAILDMPFRDPYERRQFGSAGGLKTIYIKPSKYALPSDLKDESDVVSALQSRQLVRVHVRNSETEEQIKSLIQEIQS